MPTQRLKGKEQIFYLNKAMDFLKKNPEITLKELGKVFPRIGRIIYKREAEKRGIAYYINEESEMKILSKAITPDRFSPLNRIFNKKKYKGE